MWTLHLNQYANWSNGKYKRFDGNTIKGKKGKI